MLDSHAKHANRLIGQKGQLRHRTFGEVDVVTGQQTYTDSVTDLMVRAWPLSLRERIDFSAAGLNQVDTRWTIRCKEALDIKPDDILTVGPFHYEVLASASTRDEFDVEWTILTRRRMS
jgi:hypothetical protein